MTFAEHILACKGHQDEFVLQQSMHRRVAYEIYLSRPKSKGSSTKTIQQFMPLPIDKKTYSKQSLKKIKTVHELMLEKLAKEKNRE